MEIGFTQWWPVWGLLPCQLPPLLTQGVPTRRGPLLTQVQCATRLQKTAGPSGLASKDCSVQARFHGFVQSNLQILQRGDLTVSISRSPATCYHSQSLSVGPAHTDMALNSWSTEGVRPERTDYVFQGVFAYKESLAVFPGSTYSLGNSDFLK